MLADPARRCAACTQCDACCCILLTSAMCQRSTPEQLQWLGAATIKKNEEKHQSVCGRRLRRKRALRHMARELRERLNNIHRRLRSSGAQGGELRL